MTLTVAYKLLAIVMAVALGWLAGRLRWLGEGDAARVLGNAAFAIFVPALLFRTAARIDFALLPWRTLAAFFLPVLAVMLAVYASQRWRRGAAPSVMALSSSFGNWCRSAFPWHRRCSARRAWPSTSRSSACTRWSCCRW